MSFVTVYTDASFDPHRKVGAWGVWARSRHGRILRSDLCAEDVRSSFHAELEAGVRGILLAKQTWPDTRTVLVKTDCEGILPHLERRPARATDHVVVRLRREVDDSNVEVMARWVRGHQKPNTVEAYLNVAVDRLAREVMRREHWRVAPVDGELVAARNAVRARLTAIHGDSLAGVIGGRKHLGRLLRLARVRVGRLTLEQCQDALRLLP